MNNKRRLIFLSATIGAFALYLLIHYGRLMLTGTPPLPPSSPGSFAERGAILDRNGRLLAMQTRLSDISVWRPSISDVEVLSATLGPILGQNPAELRQRINSSFSNFIYIQRQVDDSTVNRVRAALEEHRIQGVRIEPVVGRIYPGGHLASHVIGFVGNENDGLAGIEFAFNDVLAGTESGGRGSQVVLTIDATVQHVLWNIAEQTKRDTGAESVIFMAMDPRSGDVLGSVSLPDFDPNNIRDSSEMERMDRPSLWAFEPGSAFKTFSLAALMDSGVITENCTFECNGAYVRVTNRGERIVINCLGNHGRVTVRDIMVLSCNAGAAHASDFIGNSAFNELMRDFGFGARTGVGIPGETAGFFQPPERWSERSKATITMGQEIAVSAMQMLQAASVIANDGVLVPPRIVSGVISPDGRTVRNWEGSATRRVLRPETARAMRSYMVDAASFMGTGWRAAVADLSLAVKTGTSQMIDPVTLAYSYTDFIASTIAMLPADNPSLILYIAVIKPQGEIFGGRIAAPAIREAAEILINYLGIPRGRNPQILHPASISITANRLPAIRDQVPDFSGLPKRVLLPLLLLDDIDVEIRGNGWVRRQYPLPGTPINAGTVIVLELE